MQMLQKITIVTLLQDVPYCSMLYQPATLIVNYLPLPIYFTAQ